MQTEHICQKCPAIDTEYLEVSGVRASEVGLDKVKIRLKKEPSSLTNLQSVLSKDFSFGFTSWYRG